MDLQHCVRDYARQIGTCMRYLSAHNKMVIPERCPLPVIGELSSLVAGAPHSRNFT